MYQSQILKKGNCGLRVTVLGYWDSYDFLHHFLPSPSKEESLSTCYTENRPGHRCAEMTKSLSKGPGLQMER